jgi:hypothetical protein
MGATSMTQALQAASATEGAQAAMAQETEDLCGYVEERLEEVSQLKLIVDEHLIQLEGVGTPAPGGDKDAPSADTAALAAQIAQLREKLDSELARLASAAEGAGSASGQAAVDDLWRRMEGRLDALQAEVAAAAEGQARDAEHRRSDAAAALLQSEEALQSMQVTSSLAFSPCVFCHQVWPLQGAYSHLNVAVVVNASLIARCLRLILCSSGFSM